MSRRQGCECLPNMVGKILGKIVVAICNIEMSNLRAKVFALGFGYAGLDQLIDEAFVKAWK